MAWSSRSRLCWPVIPGDLFLPSTEFIGAGHRTCLLVGSDPNACNISALPTELKLPICLPRNHFEGQPGWVGSRWPRVIKSWFSCCLTTPEPQFPQLSNETGLTYLTAQELRLIAPVNNITGLLNHWLLIAPRSLL